jgi:hypothetical protein
MAAREAAIAGERPATADRGPRSIASALRASLDEIRVLSAGERHLLEELLDRIADGGADTARRRRAEADP